MSDVYGLTSLSHSLPFPLYATAGRKNLGKPKRGAAAQARYYSDDEREAAKIRMRLNRARKKQQR